MAADDWNFMAGRIIGDGTIDVVETDLPINITGLERNLSTPSAMTGSIENGVRRLKANGRPIFEPWNTVIIAEAAGQIRGMTIYRKPTFTGANWDLDQIGLSGYALGMPFMGEFQYIYQDPFNIFRDIWWDLQKQPRGNLGITIDDDFCPVRLGTPPVEGDSESGPYTLAWWEAKDCGAEIDKLAKETPFDWREDVFWKENGAPGCHISLGYPQIGARDDEHFFALDVNLAGVPSITEGEYANETVVLGAGEGRDRVRGYAGVNDNKLRRARVVDDKGVPNLASADARARDELGMTRGDLVVDQITVFNHPNAPLEAITLGNEYLLVAETDHIDFEGWVRVVGMSQAPQKSDEATLTIVRQLAA